MTYRQNHMRRCRTQRKVHVDHPLISHEEVNVLAFLVKGQTAFCQIFDSVCRQGAYILVQYIHQRLTPDHHHCNVSWERRSRKIETADFGHLVVCAYGEDMDTICATIDSNEVTPCRVNVRLMWPRMLLCSTRTRSNFGPPQLLEFSDVRAIFNIVSCNSRIITTQK